MGDIRADAARGLPAPEASIDFGVPWHYGDPLREQRSLLAGEASVDLSHRAIVSIDGPDRLTWLHSISTQNVAALAPGASALNLILSPHGHVEHELHCADDGQRLWVSTEPGQGDALVKYLRSMQFMLRVTVADVTDDFAVIGYLGDSQGPAGGATPSGESVAVYRAPAEFAGTGRTEAGVDRGGDATKYVPLRPAAFPAMERIVPRAALDQALGDVRAGTWAWEALRIAAGVPRFGFETDHKTLPHEVGWIGPAVHLAKGCYRGQEAVARVHNLGRPPRRLVLLHLDGSVGGLPAHGDPVLLGEREVGWVASAAQHYELGPIATAVIKRTVDAQAGLVVSASEPAAGGDPGNAPRAIAAAQEVVVVA